MTVENTGFSGCDTTEGMMISVLQGKCEVKLFQKDWWS